MSDTEVQEPSPHAIPETDPEMFALASRATLRGIRIVEVSGEVGEEPGTPELTTNLQVTAGYRVGEDVLEGRFDVEAVIVDKSDRRVGTLGLAIVVAFNLAEGPEPAQLLAESFVKVIAFRLAFPFVRETLQSLSTRLQLPLVTLGLIGPQD